jgi:hypothetical protein
VPLAQQADHNQFHRLVFSNDHLLKIMNDAFAKLL